MSGKYERYKLSPFITRNHSPVNAHVSWEFGRSDSLPLWLGFIHSAHWRQGMKYTHLRPHNTAFEIPLEGDMSITLNDVSHIVHPGELLILPAGDANNLQVGPSGFCHKLSFGFTGSLAAHLFAVMHLDGGRILHLKDIAKIHALLDDARRMLHGKKEEDVPHLCGLAFELITEIRFQCAADTDPLAADAVRILEFNIQHEIRLPEIASELGVSKEKLIYVFNREFGISPMRYLIKLRMEKAEIMLSHGRTPVKDIAVQTGYTSSCRFTREFHRKHGMSPTEYRRSYGVATK